MDTTGIKVQRKAKDDKVRSGHIGHKEIGRDTVKGKDEA